MNQHNNWLRRAARAVFGLLIISVVAGCAALAQYQWQRHYGEPHTSTRVLDVPLVAYHDPEYARDIKPIFDKRCVVCHGCYDAPCQLKLTSFSGVNRGASSVKVYDSSRLLAENMTRLFLDANSADEWRQKDFYPVLNEYQQDSATNLNASTLYQMLELKKQHPLPTDGPLPDSFDFSLDRKQQCTRVQNFEHFADNYPLWGMPYGMPAIEDQHFQTIKRWLETGAKAAPLPAISKPLTKVVAQWEQFFNGDSLTQQLVSRYIYEHLFLGDLYFAGIDDSQFFRLVRSRTPPGEPIDGIASRRPFDDPEVPRAYYRFEPMHATLLVKTHMPYALDAARMQKWQRWFMQNDYAVTELPSYDPQIASNPFKAFRELPVRSRYRFMLDEAQFIIMGFIKGPVCRGQVSLNVIHDNFWVVFVNPDAPEMQHEAEFIEREADNLRLPAEAESDAMPTSWRRYAKAETRFHEAKVAQLNQVLAKSGGTQLNNIWNGDGTNQNAALTVFRHFDSATVVQGFVGPPPETSWVLGYTLLERIHYLLVAGFDVYGNAGHQLLTRLYMDFMRMEGEFNFLAFLPEADRMRERDLWYRNVDSSVADFVAGPEFKFNRDTAIVYHTDNPKQEFYDDLQKYLGAALSQRWQLPKTMGLTVAELSALHDLKNLHGAKLEWLPHLSIVSVDVRGKTQIFTLLQNAGHANVSSLFFEGRQRLPDEDTVSLVPGILGAYPNVFFDLSAAQLPEFAAAVAALDSEQDFRALVDRFGVRRNSPQFWAHSDWLHEQLRQQAPIEYGVLDYNRLENH